MKCPQCDKQMKEVSNIEIHHNPTNGKEYERRSYNCSECDTWSQVELPIKK